MENPQFPDNKEREAIIQDILQKIRTMHCNAILHIYYRMHVRAMALLLTAMGTFVIAKWMLIFSDRLILPSVVCALFGAYFAVLGVRMGIVATVQSRKVKKQWEEAQK